MGAYARSYLKNKIRVQKWQVELCEIPRIGGMERLKSGVPLKAG